MSLIGSHQAQPINAATNLLAPEVDTITATTPHLITATILDLFPTRVPTHCGSSRPITSRVRSPSTAASHHAPRQIAFSDTRTATTTPQCLRKRRPRMCSEFGIAPNRFAFVALFRGVGARQQCQRCAQSLESRHRRAAADVRDGPPTRQ